MDTHLPIGGKSCNMQIMTGRVAAASMQAATANAAIGVHTEQQEHSEKKRWYVRD